ncbi:11368_t:CDS:2, partial [Ambispora gerdemannii]
SNRQLELAEKENQENEKVLEQLLKEFKDRPIPARCGQCGDNSDHLDVVLSPYSTQLQAQINQLQTELKGLTPEAQQSELRTENQQLTTALALKETELADLQSQIRALSHQLTESENSQPLQKKLNKLEGKLELAVEFRLHQASAFTTEHSHPPLLNRRSIEQEKERLTQQQEAVTNEEQRADITVEKEAISQEINQLATTLHDNSVIDNFNQQKLKNEQIVKECQELLAKLNPINNPD